MSFPRGTEMFHFSRFASYKVRYLSYDKWVSPFRNRRVTGYCHLTDAYRRLSRLSSPLTAKASTMCTSLLDHTTPKGLMGMCNDLPMFTLDSVLFTLDKYILGCTYHGNLFYLLELNKLPRLIFILLNSDLCFHQVIKYVLNIKK